MCFMKRLFSHLMKRSSHRSLLMSRFTHFIYVEVLHLQNQVLDRPASDLGF